MSEISIEKVTGWEIVPYVPRENVTYEPHFVPNNVNVPTEDLSSEEYEKFHVNLVIKMRAVVKNAKRVNSTTRTRLKRRSEKNMAVTEGTSEAVKPNKPPENGKKRQNTILVESIFLSFVPPDDFPKVDIDKLPPPESRRMTATPNCERRYTFPQRLQSWNFQKKLRVTSGHLDSYYIHLDSGVKFRSYVEAVDFLLYEDWNKNNMKRKADGSKGKGQGKRSGRKPKKSKSSGNNQDQAHIFTGTEKEKSSAYASKALEFTADEAQQFFDRYNCISHPKNESKGTKEDDKASELDSERTISEPIVMKRYNNRGNDVVVAVEQGVKIDCDDDGITSAQKLDVEAQEATNPNVVALINDTSEAGIGVEPIEKANELAEAQSYSHMFIEEDDYQTDQLLSEIQELFPEGF